MFRSMPPSKRSLLKISVGPDTPFRPLFARFHAGRQEFRSRYTYTPQAGRVNATGEFALLQNYADGPVRDVFRCSGMGGVRCRKDSPCGTRARGSMLHPASGVKPADQDMEADRYAQPQNALKRHAEAVFFISENCRTPHRFRAPPSGAASPHT